MGRVPVAQGPREAGSRGSHPNAPRPAGGRPARWFDRPPEEAFRELDHPADVFLEIHGGSPAELYENGLHALFCHLVDLEHVEPLDSVTIEAEGDGPAETLRGLLSEALYVFESRSFVASSALPVRADVERASFELWGETLDPERHERLAEIKAVTYHRLAGGRTSEGEWWATVILDV